MDFFKYIRTKEFKDLLAKYEQALIEGDSLFFDVDDILDIAEYYHTKNDIDAASRAAMYCLELYPENERALVFIARCAIITGDMNTAKRISDSIETEDELDTVYLRAEIMIINGETDKAEEYLNHRYNTYDDEDFIREDMILDIAMLYADYCQWDYAKRWIEKPEALAVKEEPDYIETMARILTHTGKPAEAIPLWNSYIDTNAFSADAWLQLAQCQYQLGLCQDALQSAEYAIAIDSKLPDSYLAAGNALFAIGRSSEAIEHFEKFLDLAPGDAQGELLLAAVLFTEEQYDEARTHIENAIDGIREMSEDDVPLVVFQEIYRQAAFICSAQGDLHHALYYLDQLVFYGITESSLQLLRAAILLEAQRPKEAFEIFNRILSDGKSNADVYIQIGSMLVDSNMFNMGYKLLSVTISSLKEAGVECRTGYDRLAYSALMEGHYDEFIAALEESIIYLPTETVTIFSPYFPKDMPISEYLNYAKNNKLKT